MSVGSQLYWNSPPETHIQNKMIPLDPKPMLKILPNPKITPKESDNVLGWITVSTAVGFLMALPPQKPPQICAKYSAFNFDNEMMN